MRFYHYPTCQTCKKAQAWLEERGERVEAIHIVESPPTREELERWSAGGDLKRLFNTSGQSWKALDLTARWETLDAATKLDMLAADGKLIKRPVLVLSEEHALFGFKERAWSEHFEPDEGP